MNLKQSYVRWIFPFISYILILILTGYACHGTTNNMDKKSSEGIKENEMWDPFIILTREGNKMVEAKSKKLYQNQNESALLVGNVMVDFYNDEGNHISILHSDSAWINEHNNDLKAHGNVHVVSDSGYTLTTHQIIWDNSYKMIIANDSVMFTTSEGDTLYGVGFESDSDLEEWRIFKPFGITRRGI